MNDPPFMWLWLRSRGVALYDTEWITRGFEEFERLFKRPPNIDLNISPQEFRSLVKEYLEKTIIHFGEGRRNPSTVAWIIAQIEQKKSQQSRNSG